MISTLFLSAGLLYSASAALPKLMTNAGGWRPLPFGEVCKTDRVKVDEVVTNVAECRKVGKAMQYACFQNPFKCTDVFNGNVIEVNSFDFPMGCFMTAEPKLYFNVNSANRKNALAKPLCGISSAKRIKSNALRYHETHDGKCTICGSNGDNRNTYLYVDTDFGTDSKLVTCQEACIGTGSYKLCWTEKCHPIPATYSMDFSDVLPKRSGATVEGGVSSNALAIGVGASLTAVVVLGYVTMTKKPAGSYDPVVDI